MSLFGNKSWTLHRVFNGLNFEDMAAAYEDKLLQLSRVKMRGINELKSCFGHLF